VNPYGVGDGQRFNRAADASGTDDEGSEDTMTTHMGGGTGTRATEATEALDGFTAFAEATLQEWAVPGAAVVVVKDGAVVLSRGFGLRDVARDLKVTSHTVFPIASSTKAFTTMALAILADEGVLDWDTPVRAYLPSFTLYDTVATERTTPRDLVTHRSGLPAHDLMWFNAPFSRREIVERLRYLQLSQDFRAAWQYQNLTYITAGYLIEHVTGRTWEEFVTERIFQPLSMERSSLSIESSTRASDYALPYQASDGRTVEIPFLNLDTLGPAGSINSAVDDMAQWLLLHLGDGRRGDRRIVSAWQLAQLHAPQMVMDHGDKLSTLYQEAPHASYGMGWFVQPYRGYDMVHHGGNIDGFSAMVAFLPRESIGVVVLSNLSDNPTPLILALNVFDRLLGLDQVPWNERAREMDAQFTEAMEKGRRQRAADQVGGTGMSHNLDAYVGDYEHPGYGIMSVAREGEALKATYNGLDFALPHYHYDVFEVVNDLFVIPPKALFSTNRAGDIDGVSVPLEPTVPDIVFMRRPPTELLTKAALEHFTGDYALMGMPVTVFLKAETTLMVSLPGQPDYELTPYKGARFEVKGFSGLSIAFKSDDSGAVTEALITQQNGVFTAKRC